LRAQLAEAVAERSIFLHRLTDEERESLALLLARLLDAQPT